MENNNAEMETQTLTAKREKSPKMTLVEIEKSSTTSGITSRNYNIGYNREGQQIKVTVVQDPKIGRFYVKNIYSPKKGTLNRQTLIDIHDTLWTYAQEHGFKTFEVAGRPKDNLIYERAGFIKVAELPNKRHGITPVWRKTLPSFQLEPNAATSNIA